MSSLIQTHPLVELVVVQGSFLNWTTLKRDKTEEREINTTHTQYSFKRFSHFPSLSLPASAVLFILDPLLLGSAIDDEAENISSSNAANARSKDTRSDIWKIKKMSLLYVTCSNGNIIHVSELKLHAFIRLLTLASWE